MPKGLTFLTSLALSAALALPAFADDTPNAETVVARVNGDEIKLGHMIVAFASLPEQYQQADPKALYDAILEQLIQQSALQQAHTGDVPRHITLALENERRSLLAAEEIERVMSGAASDEDLQKAYDAEFSDGGAQEYNASHILVETREEADAIKADLDGGADFAEMAKEKSTGPSGPNGGSLGWFADGAMVPEFQAAVAALEVGAISAPVQTQFGWHLIILNDARQAEAPAFEEVSAELAAGLQRQAVENAVDTLVQQADVEVPMIEDITPEILRNLDLIRN